VVKPGGAAEQGLGRKLKEKYTKEVEHYEKRQRRRQQEAKNLEDERDLTVSQADRFDGGEALLELGW